MKRGGRESGESGSVAEGTGRDRIAAANTAVPDSTNPYEGPRGPCPLGEYHHGGGYQLIRHDIRIRALEAELAETEKGLEIQALISHNAVARAEKAEAELARTRKNWENRHAARVREIVALQVEIEGPKAHCCVKTRGGDYWARTPDETDECHVERDCGA